MTNGPLSGCEEDSLGVAPRTPSSFKGLPEILTLSEVAQALRCSKAHVCKIVNGQVAGTVRLPSIILGRRKLVRRQTLVAWLAENEQGVRIASSLEVDAGRRA
jgi:hypothetical protein